MIGISTTLIGFVRLIESARGESPVDEYAAGVAVLFLFSAIFSYVSIRTEARATLSSFTEQVADNLFLVALLGLTTIAIIFAYEAL